MLVLIVLLFPIAVPVAMIVAAPAFLIALALDHS